MNVFALAMFQKGKRKKNLQGDEYQNFLLNKKFFIRTIFFHRYRRCIINISFKKRNLLLEKNQKTPNRFPCKKMTVTALPALPCNMSALENKSCFCFGAKTIGGCQKIEKKVFSESACTSAA